MLSHNGLRDFMSSLSFKENGSYVDLLGSPRVFLHEINTLPMFSKIISAVDEIEKYERVLPISRTNDIVLAKSEPEKSYVQWLRSVGLGAGKLLVVNGKTNETLPERVLKNGFRNKVDNYLGKQKEHASVCPYYGGRLEQNASRHLNLNMYANSKLVRKYDSKVNFKALCKNVGVPVVEDVILDRRSNLSKENLNSNLKKIQELLSFTGKIIVKGEFGASGSTTHVYNNFEMKNLKQIVVAHDPNNKILIEPFFRLTSSPSSLWFISQDKTISHIKTSDQFFSDQVVHEGNEFPFKFNEKEINTLSFKIATQLAKNGYIGPFGIDFIESDNNFYAVECNPRVTGATYPWELVHLLNSKHGKSDYIKSARAQNIHLSKKFLTFKQLMYKWKKYLYTGDSPNGVVLPYNVGPIKSGKISVLITGSSKKEVFELFEKINC